MTVRVVFSSVFSVWTVAFVTTAPDASVTVPRMTPNVDCATMAAGKNIRLVDADKQAVIVRSNDPNNPIREGKSVETAVNVAFSTGLFSMSEIAFDKEQRRALVSYSFGCGSLCGSGGVWLFEKVDGVWKKSERVCGGWIS